MTPDLIIFDCDGVLVDSEPLANRVFTDALRELGMEIGYDDVCREFIGLSMESCVRRIERRLGRPVPDGFVERLQERTFATFRERGLSAISGVADAVDRIPATRCVASSGEIEKMRLTLGLTGLLSRFEHAMFSATAVERGKPAPDLFLHAAASMGVSPERCAVVEDSVPGVQAAGAAGMSVFGYAGRGDGASLAAAGARVFGDMRELPELLGFSGPQEG